MMKKMLSILSAAALFAGCSGSGIVSENIANADSRLRALVELSEADDTLRIPYSYTRDGRMVFIPVDDWCSGFFAGSLWYMYELTGDEYWAEHAQKHTEAISEIQHLTWHHDVGFMVYDSFGNGLRLKNIEGYEDVIVNTAKSLSTRFRPNAGVLQSWNVDRGWQSLRGWKCPVIIDNMMNLELLFKASELSGDPSFAQIAVSHADRTLENHYREDFSTFHVVDYDDGTGEIRRRCTAQGYSDDSAWARGQAWSIYGFTLAYRFTRDQKYLDRACSLADFLLGHENMPADLVPYWDFNCPALADKPEDCGYDAWTADGTPYRDVSSAAIIGSALYELSVRAGNPAYKAAADKIVESLSSPAYRASEGTNGNFILMHSVGSIPHGSSIDVPLNYADYYFLECLVRKSRIESGKNVI